MNSNQGTVKSSQKNVISNYLCTVGLVISACRLHGNSNLKSSLAGARFRTCVCIHRVLCSGCHFCHAAWKEVQQIPIAFMTTRANCQVGLLCSWGDPSITGYKTIFLSVSNDHIPISSRQFCKAIRMLVKSCHGIVFFGVLSLGSLDVPFQTILKRF